ncbi:MAG: hypothetical protein IPJ26_15825 [Bacteroidetes bacterium]|nr:hypothetical protein [Bacteroidota bacterium]
MQNIYANGAPKAELSWTGQCQIFYENGTVKSIYHTLNGKIHGICKNYYRNGQLQELTNYKNNENNGPLLRYTMEGKLSGQYFFINGKEYTSELEAYLKDFKIEDKIKNLTLLKEESLQQVLIDQITDQIIKKMSIFK